MVDNMDYNFRAEYLPDRNLEKWTQMNFGDETLRLTHRPNNRVIINMNKESLKDYLDSPSFLYFDFQISELKSGIRNLKYQLNETKAMEKLSLKETDDLKQRLEDQSVLLQKAQHELEQQTSNENNQLKTENKALEDALAIVRNRVADLEEKLTAFKQQMEEAERTFKQSHASHQAETRKITSALKKAEGLLQTQLLCLEEKNSTVAETQRSKSVLVAQLEEQTQINYKNVAALKNAEQQLSNYKTEWEKDKTSLIQQLQETLTEKDTTMASHQAKMEEHKAELQTALKKAEVLLKIERLCLQDKTILLEDTQKANTLLVAQLEEQRQANDTVMAALKTAEQQVENHRSEWQKDKASIVLASNALRRTLQEKEAEWLDREVVLLTNIEELKAYIERKKKKKWWRRIFPNSTTTNTDVHN